MKSFEKIYTDIVICGGALSGMTAALAFQKLSLKVIIIDPNSIEDIIKKDKRTTAIAAGPNKFYIKEGIWDLIKKKAEPIKKINIEDGSSHARINFDFNEIKNRIGAYNIDSLGYVVENSHLLRCINDKIKNKSKSRITRVKAKVISLYSNNGLATLKLDNGKTILASLVVVADGRNSSIRKKLGIEEKKSDYKQWAFICQIYHKKPHLNQALEKFLPGGPLAILPMIKKARINSSSVIWSDDRKTTLSRYQSSIEEPNRIAYEIERHCLNWIGKIKKINYSAVYPLQLILASHLTSERFVLIGDAAHGIHPLAGQGFNLAIRDIDLLAKMLLKSSLLGSDIGGRKFLKNYENLRQADINGMIMITHNLNQLFRITNPSIKLFRRLGISSIEKSSTLKRVLMKYAMGL